MGQGSGSVRSAGAQERTGRALDATVYRQVIGHFMSGVVVVTASHEGRNRGMTVSAIASLSLDPPMLITCLNAASRTQEVVRRAGAFAVNVLAEDQGDIAESFARPGPDPFDRVPFTPGLTGAPVLSDVLAVFECRVAEVVEGGSHRVFLADVLNARARDGSPLAYYRGRFGRVEMAQDAEAHRQLRELILTRRLRANERLDVDRLAASVAVAPSAVQYALIRLVGEDLVVRDPDRGHVVRPLDAATSDDTNDARTAIELGVADLTVGRLGRDQLSRLRSLAEATVRLLEGDDAEDIETYASANQDFHRALVATADIRALSAAYEQLSTADLMTRALSTRGDVSVHVAREHLDLVAAYERHDLDAVKAVIVRHNEHAKATQRAGIERAGGQL